MILHTTSKPKIYLDTSVISALFDDRNPERKSLTEHFFQTLGFYEIYLSEITVSEIEKTQDLVLLDKMKAVTSDLALINPPDDTDWLVSEYMKYGIVPADYLEDAYHIAIAVLSGMDYLLSWNFKHIVRRKAKDIIRTRVFQLCAKIVEVEHADSLFYELGTKANKPVGMFYTAN